MPNDNDNWLKKQSFCFIKPLDQNMNNPKQKDFARLDSSETNAFFVEAGSRYEYFPTSCSNLLKPIVYSTILFCLGITVPVELRQLRIFLNFRNN